METKNLTIISWEDKTDKNGKIYTRYNTNHGWYSCFNEEVTKKLKEHTGNTVEVNTTTSGTFNNITGFKGVAGKTQQVESIQEPTRNGKDRALVGYMMRYATDLVTSLSATTPELKKNEVMLAKIRDLTAGLLNIHNEMVKNGQ